MASDDYDHLYKVVLVGDATVGKTHLLSRYIKGSLPKAPTATIGVEFATRTVALAVGGTVKAQIWDTAGQERYRAITSAHYRRAVGALLVYDVTDRTTFSNCSRFLAELHENAEPGIVIMLVGNKLDIAEKSPSDRQIPRDAAAEFARKNGLLFAEASAVTAHNVKHVFEHLLQEIYNQSSKGKGREGDAQAPQETTFEITLSKEDGAKLGIDIDGLALHQAALCIKQVNEDGLVGKWNAERPSMAVKAGDFITKCNCKEGDSKVILDEVMNATELRLTIATTRDQVSVESNEVEQVMGLAGSRRRHQYNNGVVYDGEWLDQGRHGQGTQTWPDGAEYSGEWVYDKAQGHGVFKHVNGDTYAGQWMNDKAEGEGRFERADGSQYVGQWSSDNQHGIGEETWPDGAKYVGEYRGGRKHGKGKFSWQDGCTYEGEFVDNDIHGQGHYRWSDQRQFKGQWATNRMHGRGTFTWVDGRSYQGEYLNDLKHGFGAFKWPDGRRYEGSWKDGKQHGKGKIYSASGACRLGEWENGSRIRWVEEDDDNGADESDQEEVPPEKTAVQPQPVAKPAMGKEFTVTLTKDGGQRLGLDVISHFNKSSLRVKGVREGLVKQWNEKNPDSSIDNDDLIVSINGEKGSSDDILKQVQASSELVIVVKKGGAK